MEPGPRESLIPNQTIIPESAREIALAETIPQRFSPASGPWYSCRSGGIIRTTRIIALLALTIYPIAGATSCNDPFAHSRCRYAKSMVANKGGNFVAEIQNWLCKSEGMLGNPDQQVVVRLIDNQQDGLSQGVFALSGKHVVTANWIDSTHLEIKCEDVGDGSIGTKVESWSGVTITYQLR